MPLPLTCTPLSSSPQGLQLVRHLAGLDQRAKQEAEVAVYFSRLEAAEELYRGLDRLDLAVALRAKLGEVGGGRMRGARCR
jgi:hypothetical protein